MVDRLEEIHLRSSRNSIEDPACSDLTNASSHEAEHRFHASICEQLRVPSHPGSILLLTARQSGFELLPTVLREASHHSPRAGLAVLWTRCFQPTSDPESLDGATMKAPEDRSFPQQPVPEPFTDLVIRPIR